MRGGTAGELSAVLNTTRKLNNKKTQSTSVAHGHFRELSVFYMGSIWTGTDYDIALFLSLKGKTLRRIGLTKMMTRTIVMANTTTIGTTIATMRSSSVRPSLLQSVVSNLYRIWS